MQFDIKPTTGLEAVERERLDAWLQEVLGDDGRQWSDFPWRALLRVEGQVVSHVGVTRRSIIVAGQPLVVGGIGAVATLPRWRSRGFATALVERAAAYLCDTLDLPFILLVCSKDLVPFYLGLDWQTIEGPLQFDEPGGKATWPDVVMVRSCGGEIWPAGPIDLKGLPW